MGKLFRILGTLVVVAVLLLGALGVYFALFFDPNDYRDQLTAYVQRETGRDLEVKGDIGLSVFPWLGFKLGKTELGNAPGFGEEPFARIDTAEARVKLLPLLKKQVEVATVTLGGLQLNLARNKDGRNNWDDLIPAEKGEQKVEKPAAHGPAVAAAAALAVGGVEISNARVVWDDQAAGARQTIDRLNLKTGAIAIDSPFPLDLSMQVATNKPAVSALVELSGQVTASPDKGRYDVDGLKLEVNAEGETLPNGKADLVLETDLAADLLQQSLTITGLTLKALGMEATGDLQGGSILERPLFKGSIQVREFDPRELLKQLGQTPPKTGDPAALSRASLTSALEATTSRLLLNNLVMALDDSTLTGSAGVTDFERNAIRFDLNLDAIDLDRYLPPAAEGAPAAAPPTAAAAGGAGLTPEVLRPLDIDGKVHVDQLRVSNLQAADINITIQAKDGLVQVHPVNAALYEGRYFGNIRLDGRGKEVRLTVDETLKGIQAGPLLKDLTGDDKLTGTGNVEARLNATGNTPDAMKSTLNGSAGFSFTEGALKGINIAQILREVDARLKGQPAPPDTEPNQTDFSEMSGTVQITDGVVRNNDLSAKSPLLRVAGKGTVDLPRETIDYLANVTVVGTLTGQGGKEITELSGVTLPVRIEGTFSEPEVVPDLEKLAAELAEAELDKQQQKLEEKATEKLEKKLGVELPGGIRGLLR